MACAGVDRRPGEHGVVRIVPIDSRKEAVRREAFEAERTAAEYPRPRPVGPGDVLALVEVALYGVVLAVQFWRISLPLGLLFLLLWCACREKGGEEVPWPV